MKNKKFLLIFGLLSLSLCSCAIVPRQKFTRAQNATFWGLFAACQGAEAIDAAQTYHGIINHQGVEGDPLAQAVGLNPRSAPQVVEGSIIAQIGIDLSALGLHYFGSKPWTEKTADAILAACGIGHGIGAASW